MSIGPAPGALNMGPYLAEFLWVDMVGGLQPLIFATLYDETERVGKLRPPRNRLNFAGLWFSGGAFGVAELI